MGRDAGGPVRSMSRDWRWGPCRRWRPRCIAIRPVGPGSPSPPPRSRPRSTPWGTCASPGHAGWVCRAIGLLPVPRRLDPVARQLSAPCGGGPVGAGRGDTHGSRRRARRLFGGGGGGDTAGDRRRGGGPARPGDLAGVGPGRCGRFRTVDSVCPGGTTRRATPGSASAERAARDRPDPGGRRPDRDAAARRARADVLRIDPPGMPELWDHHVDTGFAKRSALADLDDPAALARIRVLLAEADVLFTGYRGAALDRFGLNPAALTQDYPQLVVVTLDAWGDRGPWSHERGFDSIVQAATGIGHLYGRPYESGGWRPGVQPVQALDHATGYGMTAAALALLTRRHTAGGNGWAHPGRPRSCWRCPPRRRSRSPCRCRSAIPQA